MAYGRCLGQFSQKIIGDQRLPERVVINERLDMLLQESGGDRHVSLQVPFQVKGESNLSLTKRQTDLPLSHSTNFTGNDRS
jgi:hypothetical protein